MALLANPQILFAFNAASGSTVENFGSLADVVVQGSAVENTNYQWVTGADALASYLSFLTIDNSGASSQPFISMTGLTLGTTFTHMYTAIGFRIASFDTSILNQGHLWWPSGGVGGIGIRAITPGGGGNFDLYCRAETASFFVVGEHTFSALTFNTDYRVLVAIDLTSTSAAQAKFLLDGGSVQKPATTNPGGDTWATAGPYIDRRNDFDIYGGFTGRLYYAAHDRGVLLSDGDMSSVNSDPANAWTGWPTTGGGGMLAGGALRGTLVGGSLAR